MVYSTILSKHEFCNNVNHIDFDGETDVDADSDADAR